MGALMVLGSTCSEVYLGNKRKQRQEALRRAKKEAQTKKDD